MCIRDRSTGFGCCVQMVGATRRQPQGFHSNPTAGLRDALTPIQRVVYENPSAMIADQRATLHLDPFNLVHSPLEGVPDHQRASLRTGVRHDNNMNDRDMPRNRDGGTRVIKQFNFDTNNPTVQEWQPFGLHHPRLWAHAGHVPAKNSRPQS
eukprot:TRINITY_DN44365_c0_g1_i1.p1 TRINITY_DN44365_c0_g1~~TRINITY_DN44365_c0_g1_i1.p1  ORF type:complete len:152 (+),score=18.77 TRINITY_DN44365_c0_g1_i1:52-507(+)